MPFRGQCCFCFRMWKSGSCCFADDYPSLVAGQQTSDHMITLAFWYVVIGVPFSWHKSKGGEELMWICIQLDVRRYQRGLSESGPVESRPGARGSCRGRG